MTATEVILVCLACGARRSAIDPTTRTTAGSCRHCGDVSWATANALARDPRWLGPRRFLNDPGRGAFLTDLLSATSHRVFDKEVHR
jgi:hypothetical protein